MVGVPAGGAGAVAEGRALRSVAGVGPGRSPPCGRRLVRRPIHGCLTVVVVVAYGVCVCVFAWLVCVLHAGNGGFWASPYVTPLRSRPWWWWRCALSSAFLSRRRAYGTRVLFPVGATQCGCVMGALSGDVRRAAALADRCYPCMWCWCVEATSSGASWTHGHACLRVARGQLPFKIS